MADLVVRCIPCSQNQNRRVVGLLANPFQQLTTVHTGKHQVEDDQVVVALGHEVPSSLAIIGDIDRETLGSQAARDEIGHFLFIFHQEAVHKDFWHTSKQSFN